MSDLFNTAFAHTVGIEGGFQRDPKDKGNWTGGREGRGDLRGTKYGISAAAYPNLDIPNLTLPEAKRIYWRDYWERIGGDLLPVGVGFSVFDFAVNSGIGRAAMELQRAIGVADDGAIGPLTIKAAARAIAALTLHKIARGRRAYLKRLKRFPRYGRGWLRRNKSTLAAALEASRNWRKQKKEHAMSIIDFETIFGLLTARAVYFRRDDGRNNVTEIKNQVNAWIAANAPEYTADFQTEKAKEAGDNAQAEVWLDIGLTAMDGRRKARVFLVPDGS